MNNSREISGVSALSDMQQYELQLAIDHAHDNPFEAMAVVVQLLTDTAGDLRQFGAETVTIPQAAILAVLERLNPLAVETGLAEFYRELAS